MVKKPSWLAQLHELGGDLPELQGLATWRLGGTVHLLWDCGRAAGPGEKVNLGAGGNWAPICVRCGIEGVATALPAGTIIGAEALLNTTRSLLDVGGRPVSMEKVHKRLLADQKNMVFLTYLVRVGHPHLKGHTQEVLTRLEERARRHEATLTSKEGWDHLRRQADVEVYMQETSLVDLELMDALWDCGGSPQTLKAQLRRSWADKAANGLDGTLILKELETHVVKVTGDQMEMDWRKALKEAVTSWEHGTQEVADEPDVVVALGKHYRTTRSDLLRYMHPGRSYLVVPRTIMRWCNGVTLCGEARDTDTPDVLETATGMWDPASTGALKDPKDALDAARLLHHAEHEKA